MKTYYTYILTNFSKRSLYVGVTNNLGARLGEHYANKDNPFSWAGKYKCFYLIYYEQFDNINNAIAREKEIKKWRREKKEKLIATKNPNWAFMNDRFPYKSR
jgi:putative endonuclease